MTSDQPDLDLRDVIDASFGDGPAMPTPSDRLVAGRAAVRRRRQGAIGGSAAAVAVVVVASFALLGGGGSGTQGADPVAPGPSQAAPPGDSTGDTQRQEERQAALDQLAAKAKEHAERLRKARLVSNQFPASLDSVDGSLVVKKGWEVVQQVDEPVGYLAPEKSLGVVVSDGDQTRWMLLMLNQVYDQNNNPIVGEVSASASADDAGKGYTRYEDWLASMVAISGGQAQDPLVTVGVDDSVQAGPGVELLDVQEIAVIEGYTSPGDRVAQVRRDGRVWFAVIRGHGPDAEVIPVDGDVLPDSTLDALLSYLAQQAQSGEGVR